MARREDALGTNEAPDDGCLEMELEMDGKRKARRFTGEEDSSTWAGEVLLLMSSADIFDVCECEV